MPEEAIVPEGNKKFVFVVRDGKAARVEVQTGRRRPGEVEIVGGLDEGDVVVTEGTQKIRDGALVKTMQVGQEPA